MLAPPPRPPRPPGCPRPRSAFTDEEWNKLAQLLYKGRRADEVTDIRYRIRVANILNRIQTLVAWHHRIEIERRERSKLAQRQWAEVDPRFFKEFKGAFLDVKPQTRGPKSHDRDFVDRVIRCLVGHFHIRRGERLETFLIELCKIVEIRRPSIDRAIREVAKILRS